MGDAAQLSCQILLEKKKNKWEMFGGINTRKQESGAGGAPVACCRQTDAARRGCEGAGSQAFPAPFVHSFEICQTRYLSLFGNLC